jgi:hypothetical protein
MRHPYSRIANAETWSPWEQAVVASSRGACSRSCGESSVGNPYLLPQRLPAATGQAHATWFHNCDSWWRGWDAEDTRLRNLLAGKAPGRIAARAVRRDAAFLASQ